MAPRPDSNPRAVDSGSSPAQGRHRQLRPGLWLLGLAVVAAVLLAALTAWSLRSETGSRWILRSLPGVEVGRTEGALLDARFAVQDLQWRDPISGHRMDLDSLLLQDIAWTWRPNSGAWLGWDVGLVKLGSLRWTSGKPSAERLKPPGTLRLPVTVAVRRLEIATLTIDAQASVEDLQAQLELGANGGSEHRFQLLQATTRKITIKGTGRVLTDAPFLTDLVLDAQSSQDLAWTARTELRGPLSSLDLQMQLATDPSKAGAPARLDARARIQPFELWPLGDVAVSTQDLDLATLVPEAPQTQLSGHATIRSTGSRDPVEVDIRLDNAKPGRLDDRGLPVLSVNLVVKGQPTQPGQLDIGPFTVDVADRQGAAGRWTGSGRWTKGQIELNTRLTDLQPSRLDSRLAPMRLNGSWDLTLQGLPSPDPAQWSQAPAVNLRALQFTSNAQLQGQVIGAPAEVQLGFEASGDSEHLRIRELVARSGTAQLRVAADWQRQANQRWQLRSKGDLQAFDPRLWFPGDEATWGTGQHRLNGQWDLDVVAPALDPSTQFAQWLPAVLGRVDLKITPSQLVGLPFQADITLRQNARSGAPESPSQARADIRLGTAQLQLSGTGDASASGDNDRTRVQLSVPALAELAPLAGLRREWRPWAPRRGELQLQADLVGRWPRLSGQATASVNQLVAGPLSLAKGEVKAQGARAADDGLQLSAQAEDLIWQDARIKNLQAQLRGSLGQHRFALTVTAPLIPPASIAQALAWRQSGLARAELAGSGTWSAGPGDTGDATVAGRWSGRIERLTAGDAQANPAGSPDSSWLSMADARVETHWAASGQMQRALVDPGQARSGPLTLRWKEALWQRGAGDGPSTWRWRGDIDPLAVAPLMQRLQTPGDLQRTPVGGASAMSPAWSGDLSLGVQADIQADEHFSADIRIRREGGDLSAVDGSQLTPLDLETVDLRLQAKDGVWRFQPQIQGRRWGRLGGEAIVRARASDRWPRADAALEGRIDARVATLATWSRWLAPGWALQGELDASANLSGTWGAPAYTGQLNGERIAVRNPLQGVDLRDGRLQVRLEGETARIEALSIRGGEGLLTAEGQARFGQRPEVQLVASAQRLRVLGRVDRQLVVSGQTRLTLDPNQLSLQGRVAADSGFFDLSSRDAPSLDEDVVVLRPGTAAPTSAATTQTSPWSGKTRVALDLDLGQNLRLQGRGLQTGLSGQLRLTTPDGRPNYQGSVQAVNGSYAAYGQRLVIDRGQVNFNGALDRARLDILALRPNLDVRVGVVITGSATDPRVRLFSEPEMSESDKLSWLVLGRSPEGLGTADTALLQRAAMALLAGEGESASEVALRKLGLDEFSIRQSDGEVRETVVSVGKQLGRRWYLGYERGVNATAGTWQLVYRAAQRFTLRAQSGSDSSLDVIWTWRFGEP